MNWLDRFSLVADLFTVLGIPSLFYLYHQLWKQYRESHEERIVSESCLEFLAPGRAINLVPLETLSVLPRVGEIVDLPAEAGAESEIGSYRVERIDHVFVRPPIGQMTQPVQAVLGKVIARLSRLSA
jgi:hypothetical protein